MSGADPYGEDKVGQRASISASSAGPRLDVATALALHSLDGTATPEAHGNVNRLEVVQPEPTEIRGYADRSKVMRQFEALAREAERRGLVLTLPAGEYEEAP